MLSAFTNSLKIPELRQKIFFTLALLFIARVGANIPLPGVDPSPIKEFFELREQTRSESEGNDILGFYNMFTGGALLNGALFALGIMHITLRPSFSSPCNKPQYNFNFYTISNIKCESYNSFILLSLTIDIYSVRYTLHYEYKLCTL